MPLAFIPFLMALYIYIYSPAKFATNTQAHLYPNPRVSTLVTHAKFALLLSNMDSKGVADSPQKPKIASSVQLPSHASMCHKVQYCINPPRNWVLRSQTLVLRSNPCHWVLWSNPAWSARWNPVLCTKTEALKCPMTMCWSVIFWEPIIHMAKKLMPNHFSA